MHDNNLQKYENYTKGELVVKVFYTNDEVIAAAAE